MDVLVDALGELMGQAAGSIVKIILAGLGLIVFLAGTLARQIRKNRRSDLS